MEPTLYILMRSDIQDMNPGKAMAQAAHAQADFDDWITGLIGDDSFLDLLCEVENWQAGRSFGRTLVLSATKAEIEAVAVATQFAGVTVDPTYPWRNYYGDVFLSNEVTCGWLFVCNVNDYNKSLVADLKLHK
jgi:hypothetical protein